MTRALERKLAAIKSALLMGNASDSLARLDELVAALGRGGLDGPAREMLEPALAELRLLAEASLRGAQQAADELRAIVRAARSLQTYDSTGRRQITATTASAAQRF